MSYNVDEALTALRACHEEGTQALSSLASDTLAWLDQELINTKQFIKTLSSGKGKRKEREALSSLAPSLQVRGITAGKVLYILNVCASQCIDKSIK